MEKQNLDRAQAADVPTVDRFSEKTFHLHMHMWSKEMEEAIEPTRWDCSSVRASEKKPTVNLRKHDRRIEQFSNPRHMARSRIYLRHFRATLHLTSNKNCLGIFTRRQKYLVSPTLCDTCELP